MRLPQLDAMARLKLTDDGTVDHLCIRLIPRRIRRRLDLAQARAQGLHLGLQVGRARLGGHHLLACLVHSLERRHPRLKRRQLFRGVFGLALVLVGPLLGALHLVAHFGEFFLAIRGGLSRLGGVILELLELASDPIELIPRRPRGFEELRLGGIRARVHDDRANGDQGKDDQ